MPVPPCSCIGLQATILQDGDQLVTYITSFCPKCLGVNKKAELTQNCAHEERKTTMTLCNEVSVDRTIDLLNELLDLDPQAVQEWVSHRVDCNIEIANHPTVQVQAHEGGTNHTVGLLGFLNGLFGTDEDGMGAICMTVRGTKILGFAKYHRKAE